MLKVTTKFLVLLINASKVFKIVQVVILIIVKSLYYNGMSINLSLQNKEIISIIIR